MGRWPGHRLQMAGLGTRICAVPRSSRFCDERAGEPPSASFYVRGHRWKERSLRFGCGEIGKQPFAFLQVRVSQLRMPHLSSLPPAHRKQRDERGTASRDSLLILTALDRATCPTTLSQHELATNGGSKLEKSVVRAILFLERCLDMLRPGGRMAIVLPQGLFNNVSDQYVRTFIDKRARILAVVG